MSLRVRWPFHAPSKETKVWLYSSKVIIGLVGVSAKIWMGWLNNLKVHNKEGLYNAVEKRADKQPLVTVWNHHSCFDDPVLWGVLSWRQLTIKNYLCRWSLAAADVCFTNEWHSLGASLGRTVPVIRGGGVYQRGMNYMVDKLNQGEWVHTFPEGCINVAKKPIRLKWGVGRLIADSNILPMVVPLWHVGMDDVLPNRAPYIPRIRKKVTLLVGDPIDFKDQLAALRKAKKTPAEIRKALTDRIQEEFLHLQQTAESLHAAKDS